MRNLTSKNQRLDIIISFCFFIFILGLESTVYASRWWQREIPTPSENQPVNPSYLSKKRELERAWDHYIENRRKEAQYRSMGQKTNALKGAVRDSYRIVVVLEEELGSIPIYITSRSRNNIPRNSELMKDFKISSYPNYSKSNQELNSPGQVIRARFHPFPYVKDPLGIDLGSYEQLGEVSAYVIRVYPESNVKEHIEKIKKLSEAFGPNMAMRLRSNGYIHGAVNTPNELLKAETKEILHQALKQKKVCETIVNAKNLPEYVDIPTPSGAYYLEYSLMFLNARKAEHKRVHPNYPGRHSFSKGLHDTCWGPPKVQVDSTTTTMIDFMPTLNINFGYYPVNPSEDNWEGSKMFRDWLDYIAWTGQ